MAYHMDFFEQARLATDADKEAFLDRAERHGSRNPHAKALGSNLFKQRRVPDGRRYRRRPKHKGDIGDA